MTALYIRQTDEGVVFQLKVIPNSSRTEIVGPLNGMLKVKVTAPPEKGKANQALVKFLAKTLEVKRNAVSIIAGQTRAVKQVQVLSVSIERARKKLTSALNTTVEQGCNR